MTRTLLLFTLSSIALVGMLAAQESDYSEENPPVQEEQSAVVDADNPGMGLLDQATEAKLRASTVLDLGQVIVLCQRAKKMGLSGENLKYCNQLLASTQLQRGLFLAQSLLNSQSRPGDWAMIRQRTLIDLEEAVTVIKDHPTAYLRIAQLNLLPDGNENRAKEALKLVIPCAKSEPPLQLQAVRLLVELEPEPEQREATLAMAAKDGNPQIRMLHALTLLELKQDSRAMDVLQKLIEDESSNDELNDRVVAVLAGFDKHDLAMKILNMLSEKGTDERKNQVDLMKAKLYFKMEQYDHALALLDSLRGKLQGDDESLVNSWMLRSTIHLAMDNTAEALKNIEAAEKIRPDFPPILQQKYDILMEQKKFDEALEVTKKLQSHNPEDRGNFLLEIHVLTELKKYDDALEIAQKLRTQFPENPQWVMILMGIYTKQKVYDKALALVDEQLKETPDDLRWIVAKAQVYSEQKKWDAAVSWLESCLQKNPDSQEITLALIGVLVEKKSFKAAQERIQSLLAKEPNNVFLLRLDSQMSISLGLHHDAVKALMKVVETDPKDYTSINNLAWLLCTSPIDSVRNGRRALELAEKASELSRYKKAFVLSTLAAAHAEMGDFDKAKEWSMKSIDIAKEEQSKSEEEQKELLDNLQKELESFKRNTPFRELLEESN